MRIQRGPSEIGNSAPASSSSGRLMPLMIAAFLGEPSAPGHDHPDAAAHKGGQRQSDR